MEDFVEEKAVVEEKPQDQDVGNEVKAIVKDLFDKGAEKDEIIVALNKMKEEGRLSDEEVKIGVDYIEELSNGEKEQAEKWYGLKFND